MNIFKTTILMALLGGIMIAIGGAIGGHTGAFIMLIISLGMNFASYWFSDSIVLNSYDAQEVSESEAPQIYNIVKNLAQKADLPMPRVYIINSDVPNAFATGRNPSHAAVAVTTGIMNVLDYNEISGVLGHEMAHVLHRDILISTIAAAMASVISMVANIAQWAAIFGSNNDDDDNSGTLGLIFTALVAPFAAMLIQLAISRSREYDADKTGGELCGNPEYLASALEKIEYYATGHTPMQNATNATAHMFIVNPFEGSGKFLKSLFSTHPDTEERISLLRQQALALR